MNTMPRGAFADLTDMRKDAGIILSDEEQSRLIRAIESAIEVRRTDQFHDWMRGPFRAVLPHESVICMTLGGQGEARQVDFLHHTLVDAALTEVLCHPERGLAVRLARSCPTGRQLSCTMVASDFDALLDGPARSAAPLRNAVIHRTRLVSGAAYFIVLVNVAADRIDRCQHVLKLMSSHLKMALARAVSAEEGGNGAALTEREREILVQMADGRSNREISAALGINAITVKNHIAKIYRKLNVQNRVDAVSRTVQLRGGEADSP